MVFSRHLYFVDYTQYGCDIPYFNMVNSYPSYNSDKVDVVYLAFVEQELSSLES